MQKSNALIVCMLALGSLLLPGCASETRDRQLTEVARDWCMTIRASQVLPVYPLTQDLLPGDVFITRAAIGNEQRHFREKGFLEFDNHIGRLARDPLITTHLDGFYGSNFRASVNGADAVNFPGGKSWPSMPAAGFPTYNVQVSRGGGVNAAIPVQGIPLGMSLIGAQSANASVTLKDASTYGLDILTMNALLERWAERSDVQAFLQLHMRDPGDSENARFVRTVYRVYLVKSVNVTVLSTKSFAGAAQFGGAGAPSLPIITDKDAATSASEAIGKVNASLDPVRTSTLLPTPITPAIGAAVPLPSASIQVTQAERSSVSMVENFAQPLVVGYLAFDRQIIQKGGVAVLGPPLYTLARVEGRTQSEDSVSEATLLRADTHSEQLSAWLRSNIPQHSDTLRDWLKANNVTTDIPTFLFDPTYRDLRARAVLQFIR